MDAPGRHESAVPGSNQHQRTLYSTNLIRSMVGYQGIGQIPSVVNNGTSSYNSLQVQLNRRVGRRLTWSANYTWSKTLTYNRNPVDRRCRPTEDGNRPHAVNANFGYDIWSPRPATVPEAGGGRLAINGTARSTPAAATASCGSNNPVGYPNGTPTGSVLFRCQMGNQILAAVGAKPNVGSTADPKLRYPFNQDNFQLPRNPVHHRMIGNNLRR